MQYCISSPAPQASSSSVMNFPVPGLIAAKKKKAMLNNKSGSISLIGTPVSMLSCARAPFPVMISPIRENAIPSCANLPTNSSFAFVNPKRGPSKQVITFTRQNGKNDGSQRKTILFVIHAYCFKIRVTFSMFSLKCLNNIRNYLSQKQKFQIRAFELKGI